MVGKTRPLTNNGDIPPAEEWNGAALCRGAATPAKTALANFPARGYSLAMNRKLVAVTLIALAWSSLAFCGEIHDAAKSGDLEKVKTLLKANPDLVFSKDTNGWTPLHLASTKAVAEFLLANKADVNDNKNGYGWTPLHAAAANGFKDVVELLLADKADVNAKAHGMT
jgi:ankyrin repeat protein